MLHNPDHLLEDSGSPVQRRSLGCDAVHILKLDGPGAIAEGSERGRGVFGSGRVDFAGVTEKEVERRSGDGTFSSVRFESCWSRSCRSQIGSLLQSL